MQIIYKIVSHLNNVVKCHKTRLSMKDYVKVCRVAKYFVRVAIADYSFRTTPFLEYVLPIS